MAENIHEFRARVLKKHQAATRKVSRNKTSKGVELTFTRYDPRRDVSKVRRYTKKQLAAYEKQLEQFNSRTTQFYRGARGTTIPASRVRELAKLQRQFNSKAESSVRSIEDIFIPQAGMTIGQRNRQMRHEAATMVRSGGIAAEPFSKRQHRIENIEGEAGVNALVAQIKADMKEDYLPKRIKQVRAGVGDFMSNMGAGEMRARVDSLTDQQLHVLYFYTDFRDRMETMYQGRQSSAQFAQDLSSEAERDIYELIEWAETIEPQGAA